MFQFTTIWFSSLDSLLDEAWFVFAAVMRALLADLPDASSKMTFEVVGVEQTKHQLECLDMILALDDPFNHT